jgi:hypothetical protein
MVRCTLCFLLSLSLCFAEEKKADDLPALPETVTLTNGAVLRGVSIVRWETDAVVLKHAGGVDPIRFVNMAPEVRAIFEAYRNKQRMTVQHATDAPRMIEGQIFIVTNARENVKLASTKVRIYRSFDATIFDQLSVEMKRAAAGRVNTDFAAEQKDRADRMKAKWLEFTAGLPAPEISVFTDADGKFSINVSDLQEYVIVAVADRMLASASNPREYYAWVVKSSDVEDPKRIELGTHNEVALGF